MRVLVIHGPNLNLLGRRDPSIYGDATLDDVNAAIAEEAGVLDVEVEIEQTDREGRIIELLHEGIGRIDGAVVNPAAYSHTSRAIAEAIHAVPFPVIEVHLSNIHAREDWRRISVTAEAATGVVAGLRTGSYLAALGALKRLVEG